MPTPPAPARPKIYHITHVDNLPSIIAGGGLHSDYAMIAAGGPAASIGNPGIKTARLTLPVKCHLPDRVGDYVPFYFCPRSVMLYVIHMGNHPGLTYHGGQGPIVHLEADLEEVVAWADTAGVRWAFSLSNAGAAYTEFRRNSAELDQLNWPAINATDFRSPEVKEGKQAEFLVHEFFPWELVSRIGVRNATLQTQVLQATGTEGHQPAVEIVPGWYY